MAFPIQLEMGFHPLGHIVINQLNLPLLITTTNVENPWFLSENDLPAALRWSNRKTQRANPRVSSGDPGTEHGHIWGCSLHPT